ncbi:TRAP transporter substrate-binding protein DctP [Synergistes jonesii]|uniref:C4-dicarboxylate ABC transporter substrate-binding protein n=1 Tax=Synergistes jonesii TaxID=2754 RepID=A0A073ITI6_9BACT|nr:TRAP transporter substrate-binding protein DctP [Synergistes jonesii]KEJ93069.1 hypothetical protein EH55_12240 [Synergistes jonesii]OFB60805.1 hypothetical protein JS72_12660 [Synergistes jonesii]OFB64698.1 hypothetical protein JS73_02225 [Synergistes jonesii]OFB65999.1 hypothetical protein JS79_02230 [Synergistes jonesii]OFB68858.1 hypothetical protein JS78_02230 [Synergistes jonesii]
MKKCNVFFMVIAICLAAVFALNGAAEATTYRLASHYQAGYFVNNGFRRMAERIKKDTNGKVDIQLYESGQLGGYEQVFQEVMRGTIDMQANFATSRFNKKFEIGFTPGLASGYDQIEKLLNRNSPFCKFMESAYKECDGVVYIGSFLDTIAGCSIAKGTNIKNPFDTSNKNCQLRVVSINSARKYYSALGYQLVTIPYAEVFTSMQTGILGGDSGSGPEGVYLTFKDVVGSYIEYQNLFFTLDFVISKNVWDTFDDKTKKIIYNAFDAEAINVAKDSRTSYKEYIDLMKKANIKIVTPNKEQLAFMDGVARKEAWPVCEKYTGKKIFEDISEYLSKK